MYDDINLDNSSSNNNNNSDSNSEIFVSPDHIININKPDAINNVIKNIKQINIVEWTENSEDVIYTWNNQISLNRRAHAKARKFCIYGYYIILIPEVFLTACNLIISILSSLSNNFDNTGYIIYMTFSITIAVLLAIFVGLNNIFNFSNAVQAHTNTILLYDSLLYEIQLTMNLEIQYRRRLEPFMVFITQKFNQINMTKNIMFLWNYDDELASINSIKWAAHNLGYDINNTYIDNYNDDSSQQNNNNELPQSRKNSNDKNKKEIKHMNKKLKKFMILSDKQHIYRTSKSDSNDDNSKCDTPPLPDSPNSSINHEHPDSDDREINL